MTIAQDDRKTLEGEAFVRNVFLFAIAISLFSVVYFDMRGTNDLLSLGGAQLKTVDLAGFAVVPLAFIYVRSGKRFSALMWVYFGLYAISLARGALSSPVHAYNAFRLDAVFIALFIACVAGAWESLGFQRMVKLFTFFALALCALVAARMVLGYNAFVAPNSDTPDWVVYNDGRFLNSQSVVLMSITVVLRVVGGLNAESKPGRYRFDPLTLFIFGMVVLSGQRTAAVGLLAALAPVFLGRARWITGLVLAAIPLVILFMAFAGVTFDARTVESLFEGKQGTLEYRTLLWAGYFTTWDYTPLTDIIFGSRLGYRPYFYVHERYWDGSLHSGYVGTMVNVGIVGTIAIIGAVLASATRAYLAYMNRVQAGLNFRPELLLAFAVIFLTFGFSYEWRGILGFLAGTLAMITVSYIGTVSSAVTTPPTPQGRFRN